MTTRTDPAQFYLHTPAESSSRYVAWAEALKAAPGVTWGCVLDKYLIPMHPGNLTAVVSRPGHGKSSLMAYMARREARAIIKRGKQAEECVVYVSWEQPVEELEAFFQSGDGFTSTDLAWGRADLDTVRRKAIERIDLPVWMIGYSIGDASKSKPPLTVDAVYQTIRSLRIDYHRRVTLICLDYLQIIPVRRGADRTQQVTEAVIEAKHLAMDVGAPTLAGVQARREVDGYANPIPTLADCQHASAIEQTADTQLGLWRPIKTVDEEEYVKIGKHTYDLTEPLFVVKLNKQRLDQGQGTWAMSFTPQTLEMRDFDVIHLNDEGGDANE